MHPNEALLREVFATYMRGDRQRTAEYFAEDATFRYPGPGTLHGVYRGRDGILRFWAEQDRCSGTEFRPQLVDLVAGDHHVFLFVRIGPEGAHGTFKRVVVYEIADGLISGAHVFEDDPAAATAFFAKALPSRSQLEHGLAEDLGVQVDVGPGRRR